MKYMPLPVEMKEKMKVINYEDAPQDAKYVGEFSLLLEEYEETFHKCKLIRTKKGTFFVSLPSFCTEQDGQKVWTNYVQLSDQRMKDLQKSALEELKVYCRDI